MHPAQLLRQDRGWFRGLMRQLCLCLLHPAWARARHQVRGWQQRRRGERAAWLHHQVPVKGQRHQLPKTPHLGRARVRPPALLLRVVVRRRVRGWPAAAAAASHGLLHAPA